MVARRSFIIALALLAAGVVPPVASTRVEETGNDNAATILADSHVDKQMETAREGAEVKEHEQVELTAQEKKTALKPVGESCKYNNECQSNKCRSARVGWLGAPKHICVSM